MKSKRPEVMLKGFNGMRFAVWHGDPDLPYLYCPPAHLSVDASSATFAAFVKIRDKVWGSGYVKIESWNRPLGNFDALRELFRPFVELTDEMIFSWNAYTASNLWC